MQITESSELENSCAILVADNHRARETNKQAMLDNTGNDSKPSRKGGGIRNTLAMTVENIVAAIGNKP